MRALSASWIEFGDAVLAGNLQVKGVIAVRRVGLGGLGESLLRRVDVAFFHGAHALGIILLRASVLPGRGAGRAVLVGGQARCGCRGVA